MSGTALRGRSQYRLSQWLRTGLILSAAICVALTAAGLVKAASGDDQLVDGARLVQLANCAFCHGHVDHPERGLAGGRVIEAWFGGVGVPNITPDTDTGIGRWTLVMFRDAMRHGRSPNGIRYQSIFPTDNYAGLDNSQIAAIYAYLMAQPSISSTSFAHEQPVLPFGPTPARLLRLIDRWRLTEYAPMPKPTDGTLDKAFQLSQTLAHCDQCHTPRDVLGRLDPTRHFAGSYRPLYGGGKAPNITPDIKTGIGGWSVEEIATYLKTGESPEFRDVKGSMSFIIHKSLGALTADERQDIARYLLSLQPLPSEIK